MSSPSRERMLAAAAVRRRSLYARVDLIRDAAGAPRLLELELTEPSLFLAHAPAAAEQLPRRCSPASTLESRSRSGRLSAALIQWHGAAIM